MVTLWILQTDKLSQYPFQILNLFQPDRGSCGKKNFFVWGPTSLPLNSIFKNVGDSPVGCYWLLLQYVVSCVVLKASVEKLSGWASTPYWIYKTPLRWLSFMIKVALRKNGAFGAPLLGSSPRHTASSPVYELLNPSKFISSSTWHMASTEVKWSESRSVVSNSLWPHGLYCPWDSLSQNTGVDSLSLLQQIFPTQELNQGLLHCRWTLYQLSYQGSPWYLMASIK